MRGEMIWENGIKTCIISYKKWITTPGSIQDVWGWCTGMTQRDGMGRVVGEGFRMGNTSTPMANSCWCVAEPIQYCKVKKIKIKIHWKKKFHGQESLVGYSYGTAKSQTWLIDWAHYIFTLCIKLVVDFT